MKINTLKIKKGLVYGTPIVVGILFILFLVAQYREQDVYELLGSISPYLESGFNLMWIILGIGAFIIALIQIPIGIYNMYKSNKK